MDDSEQDFVDLCSKLLKRVRKKAGGEPTRQEEPGQSSSQSVQEDKKQGNHKQDGDSGWRFAASQPVGAGVDLDVVCGGTGCGSGDPEPAADRDLRTKDKVLLRMQHFKRVTPQKMVRTNVKIQQTNQDSSALTSQHQRQDPPEYFSSGHHTEGDEAMALRLQQQLDREAAEAQTVSLEDRGLFFCQICHRDLSHMTPEGRTQHLNRCLDESEESGPAPPPPSAVPDCPICGKRFKSQKSRSAHLKRCSSDMGISPATLLQVLQRQAQESQSTAVANPPAQPGANKRKGPSKSGVPARKKARKKDKSLDEETMVALALSASMVKEGEQMTEKVETALPHSSMTPVLKWRPDAAKPRRKKKKDTVPRPPPLLLVQDAETALSRLQECISTLLLRSRAPSPATPTRSPSTLPGSEGAAPLWQKSALLDGDSMCSFGFYATELKHFFTSWESVKTDAAPTSPIKKPDSSVQPASEGAPASGGPRASILPPRSHNPSCSSAPSTPGTEQLPVGSQALRDLMDLAEDGMTLTQYGYTANETRLSGFVQAESEKLGASGFVVETTHERSDETSNRAERTVAPPGAEEERNSRKTVALSKLALDLSSMVNNPQMSDVQLQVDTGEVYFAHSFMVYARCPLLAEMVHESGIGVQEEGLPAAQRVLLNDVQGEAVLALLQYLYTSHCSFSASLQPHMLELASRFDLQELEQLCQLQQNNAEALDSNQQENVNNQTEQAFMELLRSMWNEDDEDAMNSDGEGGQMEVESDEVTSGDRENHEEQVNEEELEEIYEFAATQRQKEVEDTEEEEEGEDVVFTKPLEEEEISDEGLNGNIRLEPESGGVYESRSSSASELKMISPKNKHESPPRASSKRSVRTLLQSSVSLVEDLLIGPSPVMSNLPVAGCSPGQTGDQDEESQAPRGVRTPLSPYSSLKKEEPELIVLSDSSEEVDVAVFIPRHFSDHSPSTQKPENHTGIKDQTSSGAALENKEPRSVELSPDDCSPELSWLIPSTPLQSSRSTRSSSTQTRSSICRTRLFPKRDSSSSSPGSPSKTEPHTFSDPQKASDPAGTTESGVSRPLCSSSLDHKLSPSKERGVNVSQLEHLRLQRLTRLDHSKQNPLHLQNLPYSSTPVHTDVHQLPVPPAASPLTSDADKQNSSSPKQDGTPPGSPEEVELRSFHLSPLSNPSDPSSSSHRSKRRSSSSDITRDGLKRTGRRDEDEVKSDMDRTKEGTDVGESSLQQSLLVMDEPPIAFNDSWGLDACAEVNPGRFSLRLEDSGGPNAQETSKPSSDDGIQTTSNCGGPTVPSPQSPHPEPSSRKPEQTGSSSQPHPKTHALPEIDAGLLDSKLWDSWNQEEEEECPPTQLRTPAPPQNKKPRPVVPITPMPHYSDMDTPELKNKLNRFGVRPLPKRQMILKLKQIHQYTHQLASSDSEDEAPPPKRPPRRPVSSAQMEMFKEPRAPAATSPGKDKREDGEMLSASQGSNTSSTAASEESERSNPEQVLSSDGDSDSDGGISSSQAASRLQDRIQAVRSFIMSTPKIFNQILQYEPLVLSQFQAELKAAGIRLGAAKLMDYLDSQCITFTTAKPGQSGTSRGRGGKRTGKGAAGAGRKKNGAVKL